MTVSLLLSYDHLLIRKSLKQLLTLDDSIRVVAEAGKGEEILDILPEQQVDVLLLDLSMPGFGGPELIRQIVQQWSIPVLALSMYAEPEIAQAVLRSGAHGFITKDQDPDVLFKAIHRVARQQRYIEPSLAEDIIFSSRGGGHTDSLQNYESLSLREKQVMRLLGEGKNINAIAENLKVSNKTISTHKARMMEKMNFSNNAEIVKFVVKYQYQ